MNPWTFVELRWWTTKNCGSRKKNSKDLSGHTQFWSKQIKIEKHVLLPGSVKRLSFTRTWEHHPYENNTGPKKTQKRHPNKNVYPRVMRFDWRFNGTKKSSLLSVKMFSKSNLSVRKRDLLGGWNPLGFYRERSWSLHRTLGFVVARSALQTPVWKDNFKMNFIPPNLHCPPKFPQKNLKIRFRRKVHGPWNGPEKSLPSI